MRPKERVLRILSRVTREKRIIFEHPEKCVYAERNAIIFKICCKYSDNPEHTYRHLFTKIKFYPIAGGIKVKDDFYSIQTYAIYVAKVRKVSIYKGKIEISQTFRTEWITLEEMKQLQIERSILREENNIDKNRKLINKIKRIKKNG